MKGLLGTIGFIVLLLIGSMITNTGSGLYISFIAGLSLAGAAAIYGLFLLDRFTRGGSTLLLISIVFIIIGPMTRYYLLGWMGASIFLFSMILAGALLVTWIVYLGVTQPKSQPGKGKQVNIKGLFRGLGIGIGIMVVIFAAAYSISYMIASNTQTPVLAGKEILVPNSMKPVKPEKVIRKIFVNPSSHGAQIDFNYTNRKIPGVFKGNLSRPIGSIIETNTGNLVITPGLSGKIEVTSNQIAATKPSRTHKFLLTLLTSLVDTFSFLSDPKNLIIFIGLILYSLGFSLSNR